MADILPFKGVLYNPEKIKDIRQVVTPPYDIISPDEQERYYQSHEYNMIRLDLGKEYPEDTDNKNRYTRAYGHLSNWLSSGVLVQDKESSIYFYQLSYILKDASTKVMEGFIALCKLEEFSSGKVVPHEYTLSKPKSDRLNLLRSCRSNFSFIFSLYSSPKSKINSSIKGLTGGAKPRVDIIDEHNYRHKLWPIADPGIIDLIKMEMKDNIVYIADGHHRYEASLNYRNELRAKGGAGSDHEPGDYVMMYFANMDEPGLTILPTHRLLHSLPAEKLKDLTNKPGNNFHVKFFDFSPGGESSAREQMIEEMKRATNKEHLIGMYIHGEERYALLSLKDEGLLQKRTSDKPMAWRRLDVAILQSLILEDLIGLSEESIKRQENLSYVKDMDESIRKVCSGDFQIAFLLNPTRIEEIKDVTNAGERMPQKSTYFYPKFLTGLVFYKF